MCYCLTYLVCPEPGPLLSSFALVLFSSLCLTINIDRYMTSRTQKGINTQGRNRYSRVILLIVESGVLITAAKLTEFILFQLAPLDGLDGLNALYIVYEAMPQITVSPPSSM